MKILINDIDCTFVDDLYGKVVVKKTAEVEQFIDISKKYSRNHVFGMYGVFQMTKRTNHFFSIQENLVTFYMFLCMCEYPRNPLTFVKPDYYHPFYFSLNYTDQRPFTHDPNTRLLQDLYKYHLTVRLSVRYGLMTAQAAREKILRSFKMREHNNKVFICHDSPSITGIFDGLYEKLNDILFLNKYFVAYQFIERKIIQSAILYGIVSWKDIFENHADTHYIERITEWAHAHNKNDIHVLVHFLFVPDFQCAQLKHQKPSNSDIVFWNEPYAIEFRPLRYQVCAFTFERPATATIYIDCVRDTDHNNYFVMYNP